MVNDLDAAWARLGALRETLADQTSVERCTTPDTWRIDEGVLRHVDAGYFEIAGFADDDGAERLLIRQRETALAGLVVHGTPGERSFLLNARCEPGLHGICQFSTTIQSTPSNYERRHGGAATPFIGLFLEPDSPARYVHDSLEYDWGAYYDAKRKRFAIVEVDERLETASPCVWVDEPNLRRMIGEDFLVTGDLRASIALLDAHDMVADGAPAIAVDAQPTGRSALTQVPLEKLTSWVIDEWGLHERTVDQGVAVYYVRTRSTSREVGDWSQPLVRVSHDDRVRLPVRRRNGEPEFAVELRTELGLAGAELYHPAEPGEFAVPTRVIRTSAEGGRFLRHEVVLELAEVHAEALPGATWLNRSELARLLLQPGRTAIQLRLAATLLGAESGLA
jgi:oxidase EvaA